MEYKCAFVGHEPENLSWGCDENAPECAKLKRYIKYIIEKLLFNGYDYFICGIRPGIEIMCSEIMLELKKNNSFTLEILADKNFTEDKNRVENILRKCDKIKNLNGSNMRTDNNKKNYIIDNADILVIICNGSPGFTREIMKSSLLNNEKIVKIIDPDDFQIISV